MSTWQIPPGRACVLATGDSGQHSICCPVRKVNDLRAQYTEVLSALELPLREAEV